MGLLDKKRYSWAFSAGFREHVARKLLGVLLITVSVYLLLDGGSSWQYKGLEYLWYGATLLWILGWCFHKLEKFFFPGSRHQS